MKKFATEIVGDNLIMLDKRSEGGHGHGPDHHGGADLPPLEEGGEKMPF